jgi:cephalosporin hydroxylase
MIKMMDSFDQMKKINISELGKDEKIHKSSFKWIEYVSKKYSYSYNFTWLGRPIIQFPQDIIAMQELIWQVKPDLIIETGIAHGGSLIFSASLMELLGGDGQVLGIDIDIRQHNRIEIEKHRMSKRITMLEGSSVDPEIVSRVYDIAKVKNRILVVLDSMHTHDHVLQELELYSVLVKKDSYMVVFDTIIEEMPDDFFPGKPWSKGNSPKTAIEEFLKRNNRFMVDKEISDKLLITLAPGGYLKCVKD